MAGLRRDRLLGNAHRSALHWPKQTELSSHALRAGRTARGRWRRSEEKIQVTSTQKPLAYGGFIHPWSTTERDGLHLMVSKRSRDDSGHTTEYHVSQFVGTL